MVSGFSFTFPILCVGMIFTGTCDNHYWKFWGFFVELVSLGNRYTAF